MTNEQFNNNESNEALDINSEELKNGVTDEEFSTVFSDPQAHKDKIGKFENKKYLKILAGVLAVAILVGAVFGINKWIPELVDEEVPTIQSSSVYSLNTDTIDEISLTNGSGTVRIYKQQLADSINADSEGETVLRLDGYDSDLIDESSLEQVISSSASLEAYGEYENEDLAFYGLDNPELVLKIKGENIDYTVNFSADTADLSHCYASFSQMPGKVYLVLSSAKNTLNLTPYDLAISTGIPAVEKNDSNAGYFNEEDTLSSFDSIVLSGKKFSSPITFKPNTNGKFSSYAAYITTTPQNRIANNAEDLLDLFATSTSSSSCVSFDQSSESLKKFGLDDPDMLITLTLGKEVYTYRITAQENTTSSFYVAASTDRLIRTVSLSNLSFANNEEKDYYNLFMVLEAFSDISSFELTGDLNADFKISYDEENEEYDITANGVKIESESFQSAYADFISTMGIDISVVKTSAETSLTVKLHHKDGSAATELSFKKVSETRYQYYVGGTAMGQITSTAYNNIVRSFSAFTK